MLQEGAAGQADAGSAQDDAAQVQALPAAAAVEQDASAATDMGICAPATGGPADHSTPMSQDVGRRTGGRFTRHSTFLLSPLISVLCMQSGILALQSKAALHSAPC